MRLITHAFAKKSAESDLPSADVMFMRYYLRLLKAREIAVDSESPLLLPCYPSIP